MGAGSQGECCGHGVSPRAVVGAQLLGCGTLGPLGRGVPVSSSGPWCNSAVASCSHDGGNAQCWGCVAMPSAGGSETFPPKRAWGPLLVFRHGLLRCVQHQPSSGKEPNDVKWMALALCAKMTFIHHPMLMALEGLGKELLFLLVQHCLNAHCETQTCA